jgi:hypothetical protein
VNAGERNHQAALKFAHRGSRSTQLEADALEMPPAGTRRVLKPGGGAATLEFSWPPKPLFAALYGFYSRR